ncbi:MAG: hypothetical protein AAGG69_00540 [Pseudomonadota bacterium]
MYKLVTESHPDLLSGSYSMLSKVFQRLASRRDQSVYIMRRTREGSWQIISEATAFQAA